MIFLADNKILAEKSEYSLWSNSIKEWGSVQFYYRIPSSTKTDEFIKVFISNANNVEILVDDVEIEICDRVAL